MRYKNQNSQQSYTPHYERHSTIAGDMRSTDIYQLTMAEPNPKRRKIGPELRELYLKVEQELEEKNFNKVIEQLTQEVQVGGSGIGVDPLYENVIKRLREEELFVDDTSETTIVSIHPIQRRAL